MPVAELNGRLEHGEVALLDGAVGTQLQRMGVPMNNVAWAAAALETHPFTVRRLHENYIDAGVDIITTNTYASARHNLEPLGLGDRTGELNLRAVMLAQDACRAKARKRPVYIAGAVSNFGLIVGGERGHALHRHANPRSEISEAQSRANLHEQAASLAQAGADLLVVESTGNNVQRRWVLEACLATGLTTWVGFKCRLVGDDPVPKLGYATDEPLTAGFDELMAVGGSAVTVFHSSVAATSAAIGALKDRWSGPLGVYPEAERADYTLAQRDETVRSPISPEAFVRQACEWANAGVQIVGGCCGIDLEYIRPLRAALPARVPSPRRALSR